MTDIIKTLRHFFAILSIVASPIIVSAQEIIEIKPLFEYPVAPEELTTIDEKSNYLVEHFWDPLDFKAKTSVDQHALNDAFRVYTVPMRWADKNKTLVSTDKLIEKLSKNPILLTQFMKAAEENLYGPRAEVWIDEIYLKFLEAAVKNKKIPAARKKRYQDQLGILKSTAVGETAPGFNFTGTDGKDGRYFPMTTPTLVFFGDPTSSDWRMWRLKMETNTSLVKAIEKGQLNIIYIVDSDLPGWNKEVASYPSTWTVGCAPDIRNTYDLRATPSVYLIGSDGKIILKNAVAETAVAKALELVQK